MSDRTITYAEGILEGFRYLLQNYPEVFVIGQGLWSPWYVGTTMTDLDRDFGTERIIDSPVSELATTGAALGASLCGYRPIVVHPRMDFMVLATDQIVTQAAKWSHMFGGQAHPALTVRGIINRGGEQGAQHSQALHSWFCHVPGLYVVMPANPADARDLFIASVLADDPVLFVDDRWSYELTDAVGPVEPCQLHSVEPAVLKKGDDCTLVGCGFATSQNLEAAASLHEAGIDCEVVDLRVINPIKHDVVAGSVAKTGRLLVTDGGWRNCGLAGEIIAGVVERADMGVFRSQPRRLTLTDAPAPTSSALERDYYTDVREIVDSVVAMMAQT